MPQAVVLQTPTPNQAKLGQVTLVKIDTFTIPANSNKIYQVGVSDHLFLYASTGAAGALTFSFDDQNAQALLTGQIIASPTPFRTVQIANTTGLSITYTIVIANGVIDFKGLLISSTISTSQAQATGGTYAGLVTTGAAALIFTAATIALQVYLQADYTNTGIIYLGFDNTVSATKYVIALQPGAIYIMTAYNGNLYAFSTNPQKLAVSYA